MTILFTAAQPSTLPFQRAVEADADAVRVLRRRSAIDLELGETLLALFEGDRLLRLGYAKQSDYGRERLGLPARTLRQFTRLARGLDERPLLRRAVAAGCVSMRKALVVMAVAVGEDEAAWTTAAAGMTEKELRARVTSSGGEAPDEPFDVETLLLRMDEKQQDRLDHAIGAANVACGHVVPKWMAVEAIGMEWAAGQGKWWPEEEEKPRPDYGNAKPPDAPWGVKSAADASVSEEEPLPTDPNELDERARRLAKERLSFDLEFGPVLRKIHRDRLWRVLGYRSWEEYVTERLEVSIRSVRQRAWLEMRMEEMPEIREALRSGKLTWTKALFVAKDATPEDVADRIDEAAATTLQQTERESDEREDRQNRAAGVRRLWGPRDAFETVSMAITACQRRFRSSGEFISAGEALARMADHFTEVWREEVEREKKRHSKRRRAVMGRNGGLCSFPGCTRPAEHDHHLRYQSQGGSDEASNRMPACAAHHLRSIHRGWSSVSGRAGERLTWAFGSGERFVTVGDDDVTRVS